VFIGASKITLCFYYEAFLERCIDRFHGGSRHEQQNEMLVFDVVAVPGCPFVHHPPQKKRKIVTFGRLFWIRFEFGLLK
jgi:hypothetical protein